MNYNVLGAAAVYHPFPVPGVHRPCRDAGASSWRGLVRRAPEEVQGRQDRQTGSEYQGQAGHGGAGDRF